MTAPDFTARLLTSEEIRTLFGWLQAPEQRTRLQKRLIRSRYGMTGLHRALGYQVAMCTGLRAGELRSLSRASFDLDAAPPTVTVEAAYSKRRRRDTLVLPDWLAARLREHFAAGGGCWQTLPSNHPGDVLRRDLEDAGLEYVTQGPAGPLFLDSHSLRHWYVTQLEAQPEISLKTLLSLARHSDPRLTLKTYAKSRLGDMAEAVNQIPRLDEGGLPAGGEPPPEVLPFPRSKAAGS